METHKANVVKENDIQILRISIKDEIFEIPLTEDNPNKIKSVFDNLIKILKKGIFEIVLISESNDLFTQVSKEYISHLNNEIKAIHEELKHNNMLE